VVTDTRVILPPVGGKAVHPCAVGKSGDVGNETQVVVETQGARVPALGFGTWRLTGRACRSAVADAIEIGYRHIDTARMYDNERAVGQGLRDSGVDRDEVFVVTKLWTDDLRPERVAGAVADSLDQLGLASIDLLLIHWPSPSVPAADTLSAMAAQRDAGLVRHLGVSNFDGTELAQALEITPLLANQIRYSPFDDVEAELAVARAAGVVTTAYTPIARGRVDRDPTLTTIARRHGKTASQVTLRWLVQQPLVSAIPKAARPEHRRANLDIFDFELSGDEMDVIGAIARRGKRAR
jgi:diketogulonate reductase-like aldo/keto reductase